MGRQKGSYDTGLVRGGVCDTLQYQESHWLTPSPRILKSEKKNFTPESLDVGQLLERQQSENV